MAMETLTRGQLARAAGVHPETIRFYERNGLLALAPRSAKGYRLFPVAAVARLSLIRQARSLGFTLAEVRTLLALNDTHGGDHHSDACAQQSLLDAIETRLRKLEALRERLRRP